MGQNKKKIRNKVQYVVVPTMFSMSGLSLSLSLSRLTGPIQERQEGEGEQGKIIQEESALADLLPSPPPSPSD